MGHRAIPIIGSEKVERDFGSGVLKITPGHDPTDFEIGQTAGLPAINLLNDDGSLNGNAGQFEGLKRKEAQQAVWAALDVRTPSLQQALARVNLAEHEAILGYEVCAVDSAVPMMPVDGWGGGSVQH